MGAGRKSEPKADPQKQKLWPAERLRGALEYPSVADEDAMKRTLIVLLLQFGMLAGLNAFADIVTLKDGRQVSGLIESGNLQEVRIQTEGRTEVIAVDQIQSIRFGAQEAAPPRPSMQAPPTAAAPLTPQPARAPAAPSKPTDSHSITLPVGTEIAVRTIDRIDSKKADLYREYRGSLDDPIVVDGVEIVPANEDAVLKVVDAQGPGLTHRASLATVLVAVTIHGRRVRVESAKVDSKAGSQAKRTLAGTGVGAGTGAAIGAATAGGAGAAIGAGVGAAAGSVVGKLTGKGVEIAPETRFTYKLTQPAVINPEEAGR